MKLRLRSDLKLWVDAEADHRQASGDDRPRSQLLADILLAWERRGDAMRYLDATGNVMWKPSPTILQHWQDQEAEVEADWPD